MKLVFFRKFYVATRGENYSDAQIDPRFAHQASIYYTVTDLKVLIILCTLNYDGVSRLSQNRENTVLFSRRHLNSEARQSDGSRMGRHACKYRSTSSVCEHRHLISGGSEAGNTVRFLYPELASLGSSSDFYSVVPYSAPDIFHTTSEPAHRYVSLGRRHQRRDRRVRMCRTCREECPAPHSHFFHWVPTSRLPSQLE